MKYRQSTTASSHILWVWYLLGQYTSIKGSSERTLSPIFWFYTEHKYK